MGRRRVGVVGYGNLGQFLVKSVLEKDDFELAFVWNRSLSAIDTDIVSQDKMLTELEDFKDKKADLIVEVAHPSITEKYGDKFLQEADYMIGSPTALADQNLENKLRNAATKHGLYIPSGAFWGGEDIKKMADRGTLQAIKVTMKKHPDSFKLQGDLILKNEQVGSDPVVLYEGPVRGLCPLAPNNVNTMAAAALAASNLGFDNVIGCLVSDRSLVDKHIVEVEVWGPTAAEIGTTFHCKTVRSNPARVGAVTGTATYMSFLSSLLGAHSKGIGVHLC